jgi:hypothetical protein
MNSMSTAVRPTATKVQALAMRADGSNAQRAALAIGLVLALGSASAAAQDVAGARPGDEALTCEQIYAQGQAESQHEQELRNQKTQALRQQQQGFTALLGTAIATGGLVGGTAVDKAGAEMLAAPGQMVQSQGQPNLRKERLRQLWTQKHCAGVGTQGAKPADEAMTCAQIAAEMVPYAQQMAPSAQAAVTTQRQLTEQGQALAQQRRAEQTALTAMATAGALDPTGISKRAYQAAVIAQQQKEARENEALVNSPLAKQAQANNEQLVSQGRQLQADGRLRQLMALGQQKGCDRK